MVVCGYAYALGALDTLGVGDESIQDRLDMAVGSAIKNSNGCGGRIDRVEV